MWIQRHRDCRENRRRKWIQFKFSERKRKGGIGKQKCILNWETFLCMRVTDSGPGCTSFYRQSLEFMHYLLAAILNTGCVHRANALIMWSSEWICAFTVSAGSYSVWLKCLDLSLNNAMLHNLSQAHCFIYLFKIRFGSKNTHPSIFFTYFSMRVVKSWSVYDFYSINSRKKI